MQSVLEPSMHIPDNVVYEVTMHGQYFATTKSDDKVLRSYEVTFKVMQKHILIGLKHVFRRTIAPKLMPPQYPEFNGLYTYNIKEVKCPDNAAYVLQQPVLMNRGQLVEYIKRNYSNKGVPIIKAALFTDSDQLLEAIDLYNKDPKAFLTWQENKNAKHGASLALYDEIEFLNDVSGDGKPIDADTLAAWDEIDQKKMKEEQDVMSSWQSPSVVPATKGKGKQKPPADPTSPDGVDLENLTDPNEDFEV